MSRRAPRASASATCSFLLGHGFFVHQRAEVAVLEACAEGEALHPLGESGAKGVVDRPLDQKAVGAKAFLAGGGELRLDRLVHRLALVGIGEKEEGGMAAEFQHQPFHGVGGLAVEQLADFGRTGEGDGADTAILEPRPHHDRRLAGDHVEDTPGQAGAFRQLRQRQRGERGLGRRVGDDGAAGGERCAGLAGKHRRGDVPRRDQSGDTHWLAPQLHLGVSKVRGHALDVRALGLLGVEFKEAGGVVDLAARLGERLALLESHDAGQILAVLQHQLGPAAQKCAAGLR